MNNSSFIILLLLIVLLGLFKINTFEFFDNQNINKKSKPCSVDLSDVDYLIHMIPHHQVAIDISLLLQKKTQNPIMLNILRILIWTQQYEIDLMKNMLNHFPDKMTPAVKLSCLSLNTFFN